MLEEFSDDLVPLIIPAKGGATQVVRVILTSSKEDKVLFQVASEYQIFGYYMHDQGPSKLCNYGLN
jgi:hypothetical protein